jgi:hypothetical protein
MLEIRKSVLVALLIGGLVIFSAMLLSSPSKNNMSRERVLMLTDQCLKNAYEDYSGKWDTYCSARYLGDGCTLPTNLARELDKELETNYTYCYEMAKIARD